METQTKRTLDDFTRKGLFNWCDRVYAYPQLAYEFMLEGMESMDDETFQMLEDWNGFPSYAEHLKVDEYLA